MVCQSSRENGQTQKKRLINATPAPQPSATVVVVVRFGMKAQANAANLCFPRNRKQAEVCVASSEQKRWKRLHSKGTVGSVPHGNQAVFPFGMFGAFILPLPGVSVVGRALVVYVWPKRGVCFRDVNRSRKLFSVIIFVSCAWIRLNTTMLVNFFTFQ